MILENDSRSLERNMEMRQISQNITLLRQLRKVSLEALSLALDVPLKELKKIESATKPEISLTLLLDIANYFKMSSFLRTRFLITLQQTTRLRTALIRAYRMKCR